jgi:predicted NBD/HSP70 family sugar kinase/predicted transcriptional regulator
LLPRIRLVKGEFELSEQSAASPLLRRMNATAVLDALRAADALTASELISSTGLSRPTVHGVCEDLIRLGWVRERDDRPAADNRRGRPARLYEFNATAGYALGVDLGGAKVTVQLSDLRGEPVSELTMGFDHPLIDAKHRLDTIAKAASAVLDQTGTPPAKLLTVGLAVPAPVDPQGRFLAAERHLPGLADIDLPAVIGEWFHRPVLVDNDANLAALDERSAGTAANVDNVIVLLAGERLGAGLILGGQLVRGAGAAGELAFLRLVDGVRGTDGIAPHARRLGAEHISRVGTAKPGTLYALAHGDPAAVTAEMVLTAAQDGDPAALELLDAVAERMSRVVAVLATLLHPELLVIGGAVAGAGDVLLEPLRRHLPHHVRDLPHIAASALGDRAVVVGAARRALDHIESRLFEFDLETR